MIAILWRSETKRYINTGTRFILIYGFQLFAIKINMRTEPSHHQIKAQSMYVYSFFLHYSFKLDQKKIFSSNQKRLFHSYSATNPKLPINVRIAILNLRHYLPLLDIVMKSITYVPRIICNELQEQFDLMIYF